MAQAELKIALAGNPNCGKTTLFNDLTGSSQYVGNWPGVTVEKKDGRPSGLPSKERKCPHELACRKFYTLIAGDAVAAVLGLALVSMIRDARKGKGCGGDCSHCRGCR